MSEISGESPAKIVVNSENGSLITADTVISGDINSASAIKIYGEVKGNVSSTKAVDVYGRVVGDVQGESINLIKGNVIGGVNSKTKVKIDKDVVLIGDVKAADVEASGKIKGKIDVDNLITLENTAICEGSITATLINIKTGAKIKGPITVFEADCKVFDEVNKKGANNPNTEKNIPVISKTE